MNKPVKKWWQFWKGSQRELPVSKNVKSIPGSIISIRRDQVESKDISRISERLSTAVFNTKRMEGLFCIEITFDGFATDPKEVYEIPEIKMWFQYVDTQLPEIFMFLTPGTMLRHLLSLKPELFLRLSERAIVLNKDKEIITPFFVKRSFDFTERLKSEGMSDVMTNLSLQAGENFKDAIQGKTLGNDYVLYG